MYAGSLLYRLVWRGAIYWEHDDHVGLASPWESILSFVIVELVLGILQQLCWLRIGCVPVRV